MKSNVEIVNLIGAEITTADFVIAQAQVRLQEYCTALDLELTSKKDELEETGGMLMFLWPLKRYDAKKLAIEIEGLEAELNEARRLSYTLTTISDDMSRMRGRFGI